MIITVRILLFSLTLLLLPLSAHAKDNFIFVSSEGEIIVNGENKGFGANPVVDEEDYAYEKMMDDGVHVIYNGKDMGKGFSPQISDGNILFEVEKNLVNSIVFNGKNYGEGYNPLLKDGNFIFYRQVRSEGLKDDLQGRVFIYYNGKYYCDAKESELEGVVEIAGNNVICEQKFTKDGKTESYVAFNGKYVDKGYDVKVSKKHYAYQKKVDYGANEKDVEIIVMDGKNLGEGTDFQFSEDSFIFFRKNADGKEELIYNGNNLGEIDDKNSLVFQDGNVAYTKKETIKERDETGKLTDKEYTFVYLNGVKRGKGNIDWDDNFEKLKIFLSEDHIAFERKYETYEYAEDDSDTNIELDSVARPIAKTVKVEKSFVVFDGREKTDIVEGSLRMKDGYFGFAKYITTKVEDEDYAKERYLYYEDNNIGDNPTKDTEYAAIKKFKYLDKTYIYKGFLDGSIKNLGEGEAESIVVSDGRVAYVKKDDVIKNYYEEDRTKKRKELVSYIMIDGGNKGEGDITSLVMDKGQYAFTNDKNGRRFLTINGNKQLYTGNTVLFLGKDKTDEKIKNKEQDVLRPYYGKLYKRFGRYYLKADKKYLRLYPNPKIKYDNFVGKYIRVSAKRTRYIYNKSKKKFYAYKVSSMKTALSSEGIFRGTITKKENSYFILSDKKEYRLKLGTGITKSKMEPIVGDIVNLEIKKKPDNEWEVLSIIE